MPLITCNECGNQVSGTAKACPQCGAKGKALTGPRTTGALGKIFLVLLGVGVLGAGITSLTNPPIQPTPQQRAETSAAEQRNMNIVLYARSLKAAARNPQSVEFDRVIANGDGTLVCFDYRAQNGFGGMTKERTAFAPNGGSQERRVVRTICSDKAMQDITDEALSLIKTLG
jgi:hypothetical protein